MAHGMALVVSRDPLSLMAQHIIDYDQPESTYKGKNCDGAGLFRGLPSKKTKKLRASLLSNDLDTEKLDFSFLAGIVTDKGWYKLEDNGTPDEGYAPIKNLTIKKALKMLKDLPTGTLLTSFDCHF
jgi:hypothetical protein